MKNYIILGNFTDQGIRTVKDTARRAKGLREWGGTVGVKIKEIYWTTGQCDLVITLQAEDFETVASFVMKVGSAGNIKTQTLRAFGESEIEGILSKV